MNVNRNLGKSNITRKIQRIELQLMRARKWRYLRYLHLHEYIKGVADQLTTACICGTGHGLAEVALALEFPHIKFTLTDIISTGYPNYHGAMQLSWNWDIENIEFSIWDVLHPTSKKFDIVCSTEMLEHISNPMLAAENMRAASRKYIYCLVPFSDWKTNMDLKARQRAFERHEHQFYGFDRQMLEGFFGAATRISGVYWHNAGLLLRNELSKLNPNEIAERFDELKVLACEDIRDEIPDSLDEASGIKILSRADACPSKPFCLPPYIKDLKEIDMSHSVMSLANGHQ